MIPRSFEYYNPSSLEEAIKLLDSNEDSKVLAGGQSLIALMKLRLASPESVIDLNNISGMSYIKESDGKLLIGALTTHDMYENSDLVKQKFFVLSEAASRVADQQIRNKGTIGGTICHADPSADVPTAILALDADIVITGPGGDRVVSAKDFFVDFFTTALNPNEIVKEIQIPFLGARTGSAYFKHARREGDFAIASVAAIITIDEEGVCTKASISLGSVGPTPLRATKVENALVGKTLNDDLIAESSQLADFNISPPSDIHGSADYRVKMTKVFTKRVIKMALNRIGS